MANYIIPKQNMDTLIKKVNRIKNKGANITLNILGDTFMEHKLLNGKKVAMKAFEVEVDGKYLVDGWRFVGTIEHSEVGNIIRAIDNELEPLIPSKYRTIGQECEHCHHIRDRKDTYLVYNEETKEFKQVGKTCLQGYTGGLDANVCAQMAQFVHTVEDAKTSSDEFDEIYQNFLRSYARGSTWYGLPTEEVKRISYAQVKKNGYIPQVTPKVIGEYLFGINMNPKAKEEEIEPATDAEINEMDEWVKTINAEYGYMANAKVAWTKTYAEYRDVALIASLVSVFFKARGEEVKRAAEIKAKTNEYVGNIGDRITITSIKSVRVLYVKDGKKYSYYAPDVVVYEIIDNDGHTYIWSSSGNFLEDDADNIQSIVATVKDHKDYNGIKQTVITRGKITWKEPATQTLGDNSGDAQKGLKTLFDMLDSEE